LIGNYTFLEAYERTGRILNVSVCPADTNEPARLLNYLTAPQVGSYAPVVVDCGGLDCGVWREAGVGEQGRRSGWLCVWASMVAIVAAAVLLSNRWHGVLTAAVTNALLLRCGFSASSAAVVTTTQALIWSAVAASSAFPGLFHPQDLLARNARGEEVR
jgi:hypothetical protein